MRIYGFFFLLAGLCACQPKTGPQAQEAWAQDPVIAQARLYSDSAQLLLPRLLARRDSLGAANEFEALKINNSHDMVQSNLSNLNALLDSLAAPAGIPDFESFKRQVQVQADYLKALYLSSNAMLKEQSLSLGTWDETPEEIADSILTPVRKQ